MTHLRAALRLFGEAGDDIGDAEIRRMVAAGVEKVRVRSVLTCESGTGVCAMCYGRSLATGKLVDVGELRFDRRHELGGGDEVRAGLADVGGGAGALDMVIVATACLVGLAAWMVNSPSLGPAT